jgi:hypothetical protein
MKVVVGNAMEYRNYELQIFRVLYEQMASTHLKLLHTDVKSLPTGKERKER